MLSYIGCSGYYYREWKGQFYPAGLPSTKWLGYYAEHFNTIEINATFYRMPTVKSLGIWYDGTPDDFAFTVKAPKLFTHFRRMKGILEEQSRFYDTVFTALQDKLRCVLYQFPATMQYTEPMLEAIMSLSNTPVLHAIEFRHPSWWQQDVYHALHAAGLVFVNVSLPGLDDIFAPAGDTDYLRFHGKPVLYKSGYGAEGLAPWVRAIQADPPQQLIAYFNNTWFGEAIHDARIFRSMLGAEIETAA
jgi:uncharacterized protein YecE (DUF72 family)